MPVNEDRGLIYFQFGFGAKRRCENFLLTTFPANTQRLALALFSKNPMVYAGYQRGRGRRRKWKGERGRIQVIRNYFRTSFALGCIKDDSIKLTVSYESPFVCRESMTLRVGRMLRVKPTIG